MDGITIAGVKLNSAALLILAGLLFVLYYNGAFSKKNIYATALPAGIYSILFLIGGAELVMILGNLFRLHAEAWFFVLRKNRPQWLVWIFYGPWILLLLFAFTVRFCRTYIF